MGALFQHRSTPSRSADAWFTPGRFAGLLALLIFLFFPDVVVGSATFIFRDYGMYGYPVAFHHRESFWRGEVPLWNPLSDCGIPFLAEWSTLALYPGSLFYLLTPLSWSLGVFCLAHLFLGGMGMYFLARRWTGSRLGACVAGLGFAFNGFTLNSLMWPHYMASLGWMPWVMLSAERAWEEGGRWLVVAALIGTQQMVAGPPEVILTTWLIAGGVWIGHCIFGRAPARASLGRLSIVVLLITGLSAGQLFPFFELLAHSQRDTAYGNAAWSMPATGWANLLVPLVYCHRTPAGPYMQYHQSLTSSYFLGIGPLALAIFAVCRSRGWKVWLLGGIALLSLVLALGDAGYVYGFLRRILPQLGFMRYPVKFVMLASFVVPLLAAFGSQSALSGTAAERASNWRFLAFLSLAMLALILLILGLARFYPVGPEPWMTTVWNGAARAGFLLLALAAVYALNRAVERRKQWAWSLALLLLVWLDFVTHAPPQNPTVARGVFEPGLATLKQLKPKPRVGEFRAMPSFSARYRFHFNQLSDPFNTYLGVRMGLFSDSNLIDGIPKVDGFYSLYVREQAEVHSALYVSTNTLPEGYSNGEFLSSEIDFIATNYFATNLADFLGVCQVTAPGTLCDWEARANPMPEFTAGQMPVFVDPARSLQALLDPRFDPRQFVCLPPQARPFITVTNRTQARMMPRRFSDHRVVLRVESQQPSLVVGARTYYPCWRAYVDGVPSRLWHANHAFQALEIPAGAHEVELVYFDRLFLAGFAISAGALIVCGVGVARRAKRSARAASAERTI